MERYTATYPPLGGPHLAHTIPLAEPHNEILRSSAGGCHRPCRKRCALCTTNAASSSPIAPGTPPPPPPPAPPPRALPIRPPSGRGTPLYSPPSTSPAPNNQPGNAYWSLAIQQDPNDLKVYRDANAKLGPPKDGEQRVIFLGDSITENWGPRG